MTHATYVLTGHVDAVTPLAVGRKEDQFNTQFQPEKTTRLPRQGPKMNKTPVYWPSTTLRGKLRRSCYEALREAFDDRVGGGHKFSLQSAFMLISGIDISEKRDVETEGVQGQFDVDLALRNENPFLSLWGRWRLGGRVGPDKSYPVNPESCLAVMGNGCRTNHFARETEEVSLLGVKDQTLLADIIRADYLSSKDKDVVKKEITALNAQYKDEKDPAEKTYIKEQISQHEKDMKETRKNKKGSGDAIQRPLEGYEAIVAGTRMTQRTFLKQASEFELGLYLAGLRKFSEFPLMGAHFSHGCGQVSAEWDVTMLVNRKPQDVGSIKLGLFEFSVEGEVLEQALALWDQFASGKAGDSFDSQFDFARYLRAG